MQIKHLSTKEKGHHALYVDGEFATSWYSNMSVLDVLNWASRNNIDFSECGVIEEYAGKKVKEFIEENKYWPRTYEKIQDLRNMALYK